MLKDRIRKSRILVVGDLMLDRYWFGDVHRISPEAPVPVVKIGKIEERLGGAANVARNIATVGASVTLLSIIGKDEPGKSVESLMKKEGIKAVTHSASQSSTTVKLRIVGQQQQLLRVDFEHSPQDAILESLYKDFSGLISGVDLVIFSDYGKGCLGKIEKMIELAKSHSKAILVDPKGVDFGRYSNATLITPNRHEFRSIVGAEVDEADMKVRAENLRKQLNIDAILVTRSEQGMTLFSNEGSSHTPTLAREVFDVSGAGDTVIAIMGVMLASGEKMEAAVRWANKAAGIVVGKLGTAVVTPDELFQ